MIVYPGDAQDRRRSVDTGSMAVSRSGRGWRGLVVLTLIGVLMTPAATATAQEEDTVSFVGAGWGHGMGLSQYGAYGASRDGWTVDQIIGHFYRGSTIATMGEGDLDPKENLWVNLEKDRDELLLIAEETNLAPAVPVVVTRGEESWELGTNPRLEIRTLQRRYHLGRLGGETVSQDSDRRLFQLGLERSAQPKPPM